MRKNLFIGLLCGILLLSGPITAKFQEASTVDTKTEVVVKPIPYEVKYIFSRQLGAGRVKKVTHGEDGKHITTLTHTIVDGKVVKTEETVEVIESKAAVFHMGKSGYTTSRGSFTRKIVKEMHASAYVPTDGSGTGITATGRRADFGVVAVDPKVIPLDSLVFVEGYGFAIAADTGGAIKGNKIDLCMTSRKKALQFGKREVTVHIFTEKQDRHKR